MSNVEDAEHQMKKSAAAIERMLYVYMYIRVCVYIYIYVYHYY